MITMTKELLKLSNVLVARGGLMLALGLAAVTWPEPTLIEAMMAVGVVASLFGLYEMSLAFAIRRQSAAWSLVLAHGAAVFAFAFLTVGAPGLTLRLALLVIAGWLLVYAGIAWRAAIRWQPSRGLRWALFAWGAVDIGLAVLVLVYPAATIFALLFFGAVYAAIFGAWQVAAGIWIRQSATHHERVAHGGPSRHAHA